MMSLLVDLVMTLSKVVVVMIPFMVTAEMTQSLLEKEMTLFGVVVEMTLLPVHLEPTSLMLEQGMTVLMFTLSIAKSLLVVVMTLSMF